MGLLTCTAKPGYLQMYVDHLGPQMPWRHSDVDVPTVVMMVINIQLCIPPYFFLKVHYAAGPKDPHLRNSRFRRSRDLTHASIPLAQTPWGLTGRAWLQAGKQWVVIVVPPIK